jgi:glycerol uptake facilitator-like aquaporin
MDRQHWSQLHAPCFACKHCETDCCHCLPCSAVYAFANVSGGHLNPAVSFALMCTGHMKWWKALLYMVAQVGDAPQLAGTWLAMMLLPSEQRVTKHQFLCL